MILQRVPRRAKGQSSLSIAAGKRAIATRYDKRAINFLAGIYLAAIIIWLN
jgi:transposase